ncbi:putative ribonuclease H-like domain-containing protein [Tanacetum coccineum]
MTQFRGVTTSASVSQVEASTSQTSNTSVEMPRVKSVRPSGVIIEDWVSDDENIFQPNDLQATVKPSLKRIKFTNARIESVKPKQVEKPRIITQNPKNSAQRINHQNKFVPSTVLTRFRRVPVSAAKQSSLRATTSSSTFRPVNTATHTNRVNVSKLRTNDFYKSHSPIRRPFYKSTSSNIRISNEKVNTVRVNGVNTAGQIEVSVVKGTRVTAIKALAGCDWRTKMTDLNNVSKDNSGSWVSKRGNPQQALKNKGIFDSGCFRHMTGNKDFLSDYQDIDGGFVAFGGSARGSKITGKGKIRTDKVLVTKPHNKTPYELIIGRPPSISFMRPFGCPVTNLNTLDPLEKFDGKAEEGFLVGYSVNRKAFRVFNSQTRKVEENLHVNILENKPNVAGQGPNWLFNIDSLTISMNYQPITIGNQTNKNAGPQEANGNTYLKQSVDAGQSKEKNSSDEKYKNDTADDAAGVTSIQKPASENEPALKNVLDKIIDQEKEATKQSDVVRKETPVNAASAPRTFNDAGPSFVPLGGSFPLDVNDPPDDPLMLDLEDTSEVQHTRIFGSAYDDDDDLDTCNSPYADQGMGAEANFNNMKPSTVVSPITTTRVHSIHPKDQIIGDPRLAVQTRGMTKKSSREHATISYEPTKIDQALDDESWVEAMQEELLQFKIQKVWTLVNLPYGKKAIGTKWVYRNKKDKRGIVVRNKARLVAQGYKQEEGIDYDETKIHVDKESAICVIKNPVYHSKTKHIEIRHHFIRDSYEKRLIEMVKIHTDNNVADLLTKAFDFSNTATSKTVNSLKQIHAVVDDKAVVISESSVRNDLLFNDEDGITCLTNDEIFENLALMGYEQLSIKLTFQKGSFSPQWKFLIHNILHCISSKSNAWNEFSTNLASAVICLAKGQKWQSQAPRHHGDTPAQTRSKRVLEKPNEPPLSEGHTSRSGEGSMEYHFELTDNVPPTPHDSPFSGGNTPKSDEGRMELIKELMETCTSLTKRVLALEETKTAQDKSRLFKGRVETSTNTSLGEDASKQGKSSDKTKPMPKVGAATPSIPPITTTVFDDEDITMAMAQTLIKMKEVKANEKGVEFRNVEEASKPIRSITTLQPLPKIDPKDKAQRLHEEELAELDRAQIERQRQEEATNAALTEEFDEIQARIDADALKFRAAQRAAKIRSKLPTKTQLRNLMMTYLKNTDGYKHSQLKGKTYQEIHELYERQQKRNQDFIPMDLEKEVQESEEEAAEYEKEKEELRLSLKIISGDDSEVNYEPLSRRFPIMNWEYKVLGNVDAKDLYVYKLIRADGSSSYHGDMQAFLRRLDRQDLNDLYRLVQERFQDHPLEGHDLLLWGDLRMLFDPDEKDELWMNQLD